MKSYRRFENRSICECGFNVLHDHILPGKVYEVDETSLQGGWSMRCGGCGKVNSGLIMINAKDDSGKFMPLPVVIFGPAGFVPPNNTEEPDW